MDFYGQKQVLNFLTSGRGQLKTDSQTVGEIIKLSFYLPPVALLSNLIMWRHTAGEEVKVKVHSSKRHPRQLSEVNKIN